MTTTKAIKILSQYKDAVIIYIYDHWKYQLECEKDYLNNRRYASTKGNKTEEITGENIINQLEDKVIKITDYIPNMTITYSDMIRNLQDYIKDPIAQPIELTESKKVYDKFIEEHKDEIKKKSGEFMKYINALQLYNYDYSPIRKRFYN